MANFERHGHRSSTFTSPLFTAFAAGFFALSAWPPVAGAQQQAQGFAVERFYPSAPGGGWFVMDDVNISGGLGGAVSLTTGYSRNPFVVSDGAQRLIVVSNEAFTDVGLAVTYHRFRVYLDIPVPLVLSGNSGTVGPFRVTAPSLNIAQNPDTISDSRVGFDMRLLGEPGSLFRLGVGAQLIIPSGNRADYVTDGRYGGMFRLLPAGDIGPFSYAGQFGVHIRPAEGLVLPGSPDGNELLFGASAGRKFSSRSRWTVIVGPEFFGETAVHSNSSGQTGLEGLLTGRLEPTSDRPHLRIKLGIGHGIVQNFGAPEWRILAGVELIGQRPSPPASNTPNRKSP
jgi:hypothetical protein